MKQNKDKKKALMGTIMFHLLLLLCFVFMGLKYQNPPPAEEGIAINFGFDNFGSGEVEPSIEQAAETKVEEIESTTQVNTQDIEEISISKEKPKEKKNENSLKEEVKKEEKEEEKVVNTKALYTGKKISINSSSQGVSQGNGNQGNENGNPDANSYIGGGNGYDGIAFNLGGRTISEVKKPIYDSQAQGKVVVSIRVNKNGRVISANPGAKGSTTTNAYLYSKAKEAALKTTFKPKTDAPDVQIGTIIYHFKLN
jgi:TonB family protein